MAAPAAVLLLTMQEGAAALLLVSGWRHLRNRPLLVHHLRVHRIVPRWSIGAVARTLPAVSLIVGSVALVAPLLVAAVVPGRWPAAARIAAAATAGVYLMFLVYLTALHRLDPRASCGCLGSADEGTGSSLVRAGVVTASSVAAASPWVLPALTVVGGWRLLVPLASAVGVAAVAVTSAATLRRIS